jgi:hypothetical protein
VCGCAGTMHAARASEFGREVVVARVSHGGMYGMCICASSPAPLFIEHANGLRHCRPISTLIQLGSNPF